MSTQTGRFFDRRADSFDSIYLNESRFERWVNRTFRKAVYDRFEIALSRSGDVRDKKVLDIGCGSGRYAVEYAKRGAARVLGVDVAPRMLELARELTAREGVADRCEFVDGDFMDMDLAERFDVVLAMGVFDYLPDPQSFLTKMAQVSNGLVIASFPGRSPLRSRVRWLRYRLRGQPVFFYTRERIEGLARNAGLADHELVHMPHSGEAFVLVGRVRR